MEDKIIILSVIVGLLVLGAAANKFLNYLEKKSFKSELFTQFDTVATDLLDIINLVIVESAKNIDRYNSFEEFKTDVLGNARNNILNYIKSELKNALNTIKTQYKIPDLLEEKVIVEYFDNIIENYKFDDIIENSFNKAMDDLEKEKMNEVSKPAESNEDSNSVDISKNIENYYDN